MGAKQYFSLPAAARELGVSTDVLRRQYRNGHIPAIKTPGGQPRFTAETIDTIKQTGWPQVTQSEHNTEGESHDGPTAHHPLEAVNDDQIFDSLGYAELDQEELDFQRQNEVPRTNHELEEHRKRLDLFRFHQKWIEEARRLLPAWLTPEQMAEVLWQIEKKVKERTPEEELWMPSTCREIVRSAVQPLNRQREVAQTRAAVLQSVSAKLPFDATDSDKVRLQALARAAIQQASEDSDRDELFDAARQAVAPVLAEVEFRRRREELRRWAMQKLPFTAIEQEKREAKAAIQRVLEPTNNQRDEVVLRDALEVALAPILAAIPRRIDEEHRRQRVTGLLNSARSQVGTYLNGLYSEGELDYEAMCDWDWRRDLETTVVTELQEELSGDETSNELRKLVEDILEEELKETEDDER